MPPYSPELNKIEILWRFIKYKWLTFDAFTNFQNLKEHLDEVLNNIGGKYVIKFY
ncbi:MAG: transposase [Lentimicrobiaceae bacterium]|nr:transposase [Lentimicrobiaceae bacterium]